MADQPDRHVPGNARELLSGFSSTPREPRPVPTEEGRRIARGAAPEVVCALAWSEACARWRAHADPRLRDRTHEALFVTDEELAGWHTLRLDRVGLPRAHTHVVATRLAAEHNGAKRAIVTSALRTTKVEAHGRDGYALFPRADELPERIEHLARDLDALPDHPFIRAAWIAQALGAIHPFIDANGGTARFAASLQLTRAGLPPLLLSSAQRNGPYIDAVVLADAGDLGPLVNVVHEVVQRGLAEALLAPGGAAVAWDGASGARADRWLAHVDARWRVAAGMPLTADDHAVPLLVRRGARIPLRPAPKCLRWTTADVPAQLAAAIAPAIGGDVPWTIVTLGAGFGTLGHPDIAAATFVAPITEPDAIADARFATWLDKRIVEWVLGLAAWM